MSFPSGENHESEEYRYSQTNTSQCFSFVNILRYMATDVLTQAVAIVWLRNRDVQ